MSDFLDRLATRSLSGKHNLRPRLMPLFDAPPLAPEEPTTYNPARSSRTVEEVVRQIRPVVEETVVQNTATETCVTHVTRHEISHENSSWTEAASETEVPNPSQPAREFTEPRPAVSPQSPEILPGRPAPLLPTLAPAPTSAITQVVQLLPERSPLPPSVLPASPFKSSSPIEARRPEPEPKTPDIEIHIGRVEVRAQFSAAPAKREAPKPKAPGVTLDQYLEGRR